MKKIIAIAMTALLLTCTLLSCGEYTFSYMDEDLTPYVSLGEYTGLSISIPKVDEVTDEAVENRIAENIAEHATETEVNRACEMGDTVNIDFTGMIDGEEFSGGSAAEQEFVLGEGGYIDGFEDGIVGMTKGEVKVIDVTFPEDYGNEELNGKAAQFEITLNKVAEITPAVLTDEIAQEFDCETAEDYRAQVREELVEEYEAAVIANKHLYAWTAVVNNCEIKGYPEEWVDKMANDLYDYWEAVYYQYGITPENLGITRETLKETAQGAVKEELVLYAIAKAGGYTVTDEEYEAKVSTLAANEQITVSDYKSHYSRQNTETKVLYEKIMSDVLESATFTEDLVKE